MSDLKTFLKVAQKLGYPNPSPNSLVIANSINYNLNSFIEDLILEVGHERANEFVNKTFSSLGATYSPGIKMDFGLVLVKINIPKKIKGVGLLIENFSLFPKEEEFLIQPFSKLKLVARNDKAHYYHINEKFERIMF